MPVPALPSDHPDRQADPASGPGNITQADLDAVRDVVTAEREAQGLPPHISDQQVDDLAFTLDRAIQRDRESQVRGATSATSGRRHGTSRTDGAR